MLHSHLQKVLSLLGLISFLILGSTSLSAQTSESDKPQYDVWRGNTAVVQTKTEEVRGSQYYLEEFAPGKIILRDKTVSSKLLLNYNSYENRVVFRDGDVLRAYDPTKIQGFIILDEDGNVKEQFMNGIYDKEHHIEPTDLLRVVYKGDTKLLAKHETFFSKNSSRDAFSNTKYSEFRDRTHYYLLKEDGGLVETKLKRRAFINDLGHHQKELNKYAKAANLNIRSEREAITLLYYFDQID